MASIKYVEAAGTLNDGKGRMDQRGGGGMRLVPNNEGIQGNQYVEMPRARVTL